MQEHHKAFMEKSLDLARYSYSINEVPVGAIVTLDNKIIEEDSIQLLQRIHQYIMLKSML